MPIMRRRFDPRVIGNEMREVFLLIAELAKAGEDIELGGDCYVTWNWQKRMRDIADKAKTLADHPSSWRSDPQTREQSQE